MNQFKRDEEHFDSNSPSGLEMGNFGRIKVECVQSLASKF